MRKIVFVFLTLVITYCILWVVVANVIENKVKESINGLNSEKIQANYFPSKNQNLFPWKTFYGIILHERTTEAFRDRTHNLSNTP